MSLSSGATDVLASCRRPVQMNGLPCMQDNRRRRGGVAALIRPGACVCPLPCMQFTLLERSLSARGPCMAMALMTTGGGAGVCFAIFVVL